MRALARALGTDPMNGRRLALALERMGLLEIRGSRSDVRAREVFTTPAGADLARRLTQRAKDQQRALVEGLGEERAAVLRTLLARLDFTLSDDRTRLSEKRQGESQASSDARPC
jgi:DNA-binding MarR family transcriptional regulator